MRSKHEARRSRSLRHPFPAGSMQDARCDLRRTPTLALLRTPLLGASVNRGARLRHPAPKERPAESTNKGRERAPCRRFRSPTPCGGPRRRCRSPFRHAERQGRRRSWRAACRCPGPRTKRPCHCLSCWRLARRCQRAAAAWAADRCPDGPFNRSRTNARCPRVR